MTTNELIALWQSEQLTLSETKKLLDRLIQERNPLPEPKWEPKGGGYYVTSDGAGLNGGSQDTGRQYGIEFETREAAEKAAKYYRFIHRLYKLAEELNEGWEPDWRDVDQHKFSVWYDHGGGKYEVDSYWRIDLLAPVFKDKTTVNKAIEILNQEELPWT